MTEKKKKKIFIRPMIAIAAIISILLTGGVVANAVTDGAVSENIAAVAQAVGTKFTIFKNGKQVDEIELDENEQNFINSIENDFKDFGSELKINIEKNDEDTVDLHAYVDTDFGSVSAAYKFYILTNMQPVETENN